MGADARARRRENLAPGSCLGSPLRRGASFTRPRPGELRTLLLVGTCAAVTQLWAYSAMARALCNFAIASSTDLKWHPTLSLGSRSTTGRSTPSMYHRRSEGPGKKREPVGTKT